MIEWKSYALQQEKAALMWKNKAEALQQVLLADQALNLENSISSATVTDKKGGSKMNTNRIRLPIPERYGGGFATGNTLPEAVDNLLKRTVEKERDDTPLFSDCLETWYELKVAGRKETTTSVYRMIADKHILPFFADKKIGEITRDDIQRYFNSIMDKSASLSKQSRTILNQVYDRAVWNGDVQKNLMEYHGYMFSKKEKKRVVLQDDEYISVVRDLDKLESDIMSYLYMCITVLTGMRRGEVLGLRWEDIDFENNVIHISRAVSFPNGQNNGIIDLPKDDSTGDQPMIELLAKKLKPYQLDPHIYVVGCKDTPITKSSFTKMIYRVNKVIDLKGATPHSFRHTYASNLNNKCYADTKSIQAVLRQKTPALAMEVYVDPNKQNIQSANEKLNDYICTSIAQNCNKKNA